MRVLIALGGNALLPRGQRADAAVQVEHVATVAPALAHVAVTHELIVNHGNGPQVGMLALESADDDALSRPYPLDALVAETQGMIGYWLQQAIGRLIAPRQIVSVVSQTLVAADDPAFGDPTKFIGASYTQSEAKELAQRRGWQVRQDGDHWRRVVASPAPVRVIETPVVDALARAGTTVICAGGGGSPVIEGEHGLEGVEAVVDKDHVAAMLALDLGCERLVLLTDVPNVFADYGTPQQRALGTVSVDELAGDRFAAGSMGPKVAASCHFVRESGHVAAIGALDDLDDVLGGGAGTQIVPDD